ncbi:MAG: ACP S-malonyltransferase [Deltaproteobacteria bacterium]|nr:ACP S-malonyltransferase [Deltaproteobacteria bacterium]
MVVALFPGQGSQFVGMGKALYEQFQKAREVFEESEDAVHVNIKKLCFDGPHADLTLTKNTQPCLLTVSVAAFRVAEAELGIKPDCVVGHSLGEYSALVVAKSISLSTAVRWVRERGQAMQEAVPLGEGAMAAVLGLEDEEVQKLCQEAQEDTTQALVDRELSIPTLVRPANYNAPGQVVIAGSKNAVARACEILKEKWKRGKSIPLEVSAPFHCELMQPAQTEMAKIFEQTQEKPLTPLCPYVPNLTARITQEKEVIIEFLTQQITKPVLWRESIEKLCEKGYDRFIEFGPGQVLQGLTKRIAKNLNFNPTVMSCSDPDSLKGLSICKN